MFAPLFAGKTFLAASAALIISALLAGGALVVQKQGYDSAVAVLQPKLDQMHATIGVLTTTNASEEATIAAMTANQAANDALVAQYQTQVTTLNQQADDTTSVIRKLQTDDKTVDQFLRIPIPDALLRVLNDAGANAPTGSTDQNGIAATPQAGAVSGPGK
jgi:LPS O-antigen subunit length determinant protein (WzzB/FepE family)